MEALLEQRQFAPGTMLDEKYRIDELLAVGGMGAVYIGTHTKLRKRVAIKVVNPQLSNPMMIERFHREAITASQIGHEGIAQVTDLGMSSDGEPFLVMELLDGESLAKRLKVAGALPIDEACRLGAAILSPLDAAHRAGIVHRDLKPDNVFLVRQSRGEMVKLLDFGISRAAGLDAEFRLTTTGLVLGTPTYMSPEQARGESEVTHLADIYAFGVILYEMLCGQVPIQGENYNRLMFKVITGDYRPPRELRPDLPRELENIVLAAIALDPQARPQSAAVLEQALLPFCSSAPRARKKSRSAPSPRAAVTPVTPVTAPTVPNGANRTMLAATPEAGKRRRWLVIAGVAVVSVIGVATVVATTNRTSAVSPVPATSTQAKSGQPELVEAKPAAIKPAATEQTAIKSAEPPSAEAQPAAPRPGVAKPAVAKPAVAEPLAEIAPHANSPSNPTMIRLTFSVVPASARVFVDGSRLKTNEIVVAKDDASHTMQISAPGYLPHDETIKFDETQKLTIELSRDAKAPRTPKVPTTKKRSDKIESQSPYD